MKNDSTSFFENNHFANSYVYDISISHVPAYFGLHWHHYIEIVLAQDDGIIYEVNGEAFPLKPGDLLFIWPGELHAVSTTNREHRLIMLQLDADFLEKRVDFQSVAYLFYQIRLLNQNNFPEIEKLRGFLTELRRLSLSGISFSELFRAYTGLSFTDFVTRERLHIAENLLKKPDLTITEVSLESGFNSISTFNRVFLKSKNVSPTDFRQMYLQSYQK